MDEAQNHKLSKISKTDTKQYLQYHTISIKSKNYFYIEVLFEFQIVNDIQHTEKYREKKTQACTHSQF